MLSAEPVVYNNAAAYCRWRGGYLLVVDDENERRAVDAFIRQEVVRRPKLRFYNYFFVGAVANVANRVWYNIQGDLLDDGGYDYWDWENGQPNNVGHEYCGGWERYAGLLHDIVCYTERYFICEYPAESELAKYT